VAVDPALAILDMPNCDWSNVVSDNSITLNDTATLLRRGCIALPSAISHILVHTLLLFNQTPYYYWALSAAAFYSRQYYTEPTHSHGQHRQ